MTEEREIIPVPWDKFVDLILSMTMEDFIVINRILRQKHGVNFRVIPVDQEEPDED